MIEKSIKIKWFFWPVLIWGIISIFSFCTEEKTESITPRSPFLNHGDSAHYVGIETCKQCHSNIYDTYIQTGMGQSFGLANQSKSSSKINDNNVLYDKKGDFYYKPFWKNDSLFFCEFRLNKSDTIYKRTELINYIIGSGQHTNSHLINRNGFVFQAPMTYYTQKGFWDFPPGFENGHNTRFNRKIESECMTCHNAYPSPVEGSLNKYSKIAVGIDCERCHGPGSIHVARKSKGELIDTSREADFSIVNPGKLTLERQFDICQRCHLQGNSVLKFPHGFYDFKPGMKLSDFQTVFLPRYSDSKDNFIMASHADRIKRSKCFIESAKKADLTKIRPYKTALTCVTCHNPHISSKQMGDNYFNQKCSSCHNLNHQKKCSNSNEINKKSDNNCVKCHMPRSGSTDIPHVSVHDHYIRKPLSSVAQDSIRKFISLYAVNEPNPDANTRAEAFLNQFEKFETKEFYLDSAYKYLKENQPVAFNQRIYLLIRFYFLKNNYKAITRLISNKGTDFCFNQVRKIPKSENRSAWTAYRIGEAEFNEGNLENALKWYQLSVELAPYMPEFLIKYGVTLASKGETKQAIDIFNKVINFQPKQSQAWNNKGYILMQQGDISGAENCFYEALKFEPDYDKALINLAAIYLRKNQSRQALELIQLILKRNPAHQQAKKIHEMLQ